MHAGGEHTCIMGGQLDNWCWGDNSTGALGDGTTNSRPWAQPVPKPEPDMAPPIPGRFHTCAMSVTAQNVYCWGDNSLGQLGDGTTTSRLTPEFIVHLNGFASWSAGAQHTCVGGDGGAACWGLNSFGELGDGTTTQRLSPVAVAGFGATFSVVAAGGLSHTCGRANGPSSNGELYCWGANGAGQLGNGTFRPSSVPVAVTSLGTSVDQISHGGFDFTCATKSDKTMWCWGANESGQLGDGTQTNRLLPQQVILSVPPPVPAAPAAVKVALAMCLLVLGRILVRRGSGSTDGATARHPSA
jgi:alpha-tubulin suppressor-like RCC1 family protein